MQERKPRVLGWRQAGWERQQRQDQELADEARWPFEQTRPAPGARVVPVVCGPRGCVALHEADWSTHACESAWTRIVGLFADCAPRNGILPPSAARSRASCASPA